MTDILQPFLQLTPSSPSIPRILCVISQTFGTILIKPIGCLKNRIAMRWKVFEYFALLLFNVFVLDGVVVCDDKKPDCVTCDDDHHNVKADS